MPYDSSPITLFKGVDLMLIFKKISFNNWLFTVLALQYALMHLFKLHIPNSVKLSEIIIFIVYTVSEIILFIYRGRRAAVGAVSGMIPLFLRCFGLSPSFLIFKARFMWQNLR